MSMITCFYLKFILNKFRNRALNFSLSLAHDFAKRTPLKIKGAIIPRE